MIMNRNVECAYNPENTPIGQGRCYEENSAPLIKPGAVRQILKKMYILLEKLVAGLLAIENSSLDQTTKH